MKKLQSPDSCKNLSILLENMVLSLVEFIEKKNGLNLLHESSNILSKYSKQRKLLVIV